MIDYIIIYRQQKRKEYRFNLKNNNKQKKNNVKSNKGNIGA